MPSFFERALSPRGDGFFLRRTFKKAKTPSTDSHMADIPLSRCDSLRSSAASPPRATSPPGARPYTPTGSTKNAAFSRRPEERNAARESDLDDEPVLFDGPPPPIVRSVYMPSPGSSPSASPTRDAGRLSAGNLAASLASLGSVFFDTGRARKQPPRIHQANPDSMWRRMQRHEKALSADLQAILDMQADALANGFTGGSRSASPESSYTQNSSGRSTPTGAGTFYSAASSKGKMAAAKSSLVQHNSLGPDGIVMPVRQPEKPKKLSLRAARRALSRSLAELSDLKYHEHRHIKAEIKSRTRALARAERLAARQLQISTELGVLEHDGDEELARELHGLDAEHGALTTEIDELEARLLLLRNKRRWVADKMLHVKSKREAGLSGYRGALKEVDSEIRALVRQPPVEPLQTEAYAQLHVVDDEGVPITAPGGAEFLGLLPERRTLDMAKQWWEAEIKILEAKSDAVKKDRVALDDGGHVWAATAKLVGDYEASLRRQMKELAACGNSDAREAEDTVNGLMVRMDEVIAVLRRNLDLATTKKWNLLICAIGAELEAFQAAEKMLRFGMPATDDHDDDGGAAAAADLFMQSDALIDTGLTGTSASMSAAPAVAADDEEDDEAEHGAKFKVKRVGLSSPVAAPFAQSSESLPSPAFKPCLLEDNDEYSDNEVPEDLLLE